MAKASKNVSPVQDNTDATDTATADATVATVATTETAAPVKRIAPEMTAISANVPIPTRKNARGSKSSYPFDKLEIGQSFGIRNKSAKNLASIVSSANKRAMLDKRDENGAIVYKVNKASDGNGGFVNIPTNKPEKIAGKHYFVMDVDASTDPDGASVRVWRDA